MLSSVSGTPLSCGRRLIESCRQSECKRAGQEQRRSNLEEVPQFGLPLIKFCPIHTNAAPDETASTTTLEIELEDRVHAANIAAHATSSTMIVIIKAVPIQQDDAFPSGKLDAIAKLRPKSRAATPPSRSLLDYTRDKATPSGRWQYPLHQT